ncbi:MAG: ABC transporter permease [Anaerolineae bacterium]|nr:ABC transporter permease [Anaerolineae bacterium]
MDILLLVSIAQSILAATWRMATPLIYTAIGEIFTERSGVINIGLEGIMLIGALSGYVVTSYTDSLFLGISSAVLSGIISGLLFSLFTVTIKANQIVVGAAFNMIGTGLTGFIYRTLYSGGSTDKLVLDTFPSIKIPLLSDIPFFGEILFQQNLMVYATVVLVPLAAFILSKTAFGLYVKAVGEHPKAADTSGINVTLIRYISTTIGATLAALGGAYLSMAHANQFVEGIATGRGFIALAVVVFGRWSPWGAMGASLLFGVFYALQLRLQAMSGNVIPYQFLQVLPYLATLIVLVSLKGRGAEPKALGKPYKA